MNADTTTLTVPTNAHEALQHTIAAYDIPADRLDEFAILATSNAIARGVRTGLTWRNLRELDDQVVALRSLATRLRDALRDFAAYQNGTDYNGSPFERDTVDPVLADADALLSTTKGHDHA